MLTDSPGLNIWIIVRQRRVDAGWSVCLMVPNLHCPKNNNSEQVLQVTSDFSSLSIWKKRHVLWTTLFLVVASNIIGFLGHHIVCKPQVEQWQGSLFPHLQNLLSYSFLDIGGGVNFTHPSTIIMHDRRNDKSNTKDCWMCVFICINMHTLHIGLCVCFCVLNVTPPFLEIFIKPCDHFIPYMKRHQDCSVVITAPTAICTFIWFFSAHFY